MAQHCTELVRKGNDFPTIWATMLKRHPLVESVPHSKIEDARTILEIRLITGERLVFDGDAREFSVK